jgi:hypothetical protein
MIYNLLASIKRVGMSLDEANMLTVRELLEFFGVYLRESKPQRKRATQQDIDKMFS